MVSNAVTRLVFFLSIVSALCYFIAQAKPIENGDAAEKKTYWTIHLLKLKPGAYAYDCDAVLLTTPGQNETVQTSQLLLTTVSCLMQKDSEFGENRFVNEKEISALFIERDSNGRFMNYIEMEVQNIHIPEWYHKIPSNYKINAMALIKLKEAVPIRETMAPLAISDVPISDVSRCFVARRPRADGLSSYRRLWNLSDRNVFIDEARLKEYITLIDVETQLDGGKLKADVFDSEEKSSLQFTLGSPLICRHNGVDVVQGLIDEIRYDIGLVILNESNETSYIGSYSTPVKIGPPNTFCVAIITLYFGFRLPRCLEAGEGQYFPIPYDMYDGLPQDFSIVDNHKTPSIAFRGRLQILLMDCRNSRRDYAIRTVKRFQCLCTH